MLVLQDKIPPNNWNLAPVIQEPLGTGGQVYSVSLKTAIGLLERPVVKLVS